MAFLLKASKPGKMVLSFPFFQSFNDHFWVKSHVGLQIERKQYFHLHLPQALTGLLNRRVYKRTFHQENWMVLIALR